MSFIQKALITGASGFIGRRLRAELISTGVDVIAIRRPGSPPATTGRSVTASYDDVPALERIFADEKPDIVFHLAGVTKGRSYADFERGNVMPTANLLRAAEREHPSLERFVHISSLTAYGPSSISRPLVESDPRRPIEYYGQSKRAAEETVEASDLRWTIMRPSGVYGPGDADYFELFKLVDKRLNVFFGNRERSFSAIYVDDCVRAIIEAANHDQTLFEGYFLTDDRPTTWGEFQQRIVRNSGRRCVTLDLPEQLVTLAAHMGELASRIDGKARLMNRQKAKMGQQKAWLCSGMKATEHFAFSSRIDHEEGIARTDAWYRNEGWYG